MCIRDSIYTITKNDDKKLRLILNETNNVITRVLGNPRYDQVNKSIDQYSIEHTKGILKRRKSIILGSMHIEDRKNIIEGLMNLINENNDLHIYWVPHEPIPKQISLVFDYFSDKGFSVDIYSKQKTDNKNFPRVIIVDVIGVLSQLYWEGIIAYIGGGFSAGIHNVMELSLIHI